MLSSRGVWAGGGRVCETREDVSSALEESAARCGGRPRECVMGEWVGEPLRGSEKTRERTLPDSRRSVCVGGVVWCVGGMVWCGCTCVCGWCGVVWCVGGVVWYGVGVHVCVCRGQSLVELVG